MKKEWEGDEHDAGEKNAHQFHHPIRIKVRRIGCDVAIYPQEN